MSMTDSQVNEMVGKLRIAFGVKTTDDLVNEMVTRFLCWKLPKDFAPDAGIHFMPSPSLQYDSPHWPIGTNLLTADQAKEMIKHLLGDA